MKQKLFNNVQNGNELFNLDNSFKTQISKNNISLLYNFYFNLYLMNVKCDKICFVEARDLNEKKIDYDIFQQILLKMYNKL